MKFLWHWLIKKCCKNKLNSPYYRWVECWLNLLTPLAVALEQNVPYRKSLKARLSWTASYFSLYFVLNFLSLNYKLNAGEREERKEDIDYEGRTCEVLRAHGEHRQHVHVRRRKSGSIYNIIVSDYLRNKSSNKFFTPSTRIKFKWSHRWDVINRPQVRAHTSPIITLLFCCLMKQLYWETLHFAQKM